MYLEKVYISGIIIRNNKTMKKFETLKELKETAKLYMLPGKYNEELNEQLHMSIDMIGREYSSRRL
mgnify:FL=1